MSSGVYLTVVVPIRNEENYIRKTLEELASQQYPKERYELVVVDGRSTDRTRNIVETFIRERPDVDIRLLDNPGRWSSRARNIGVRAAQGHLIAVIDGHVHIPNDQLFATMERLTEEHDALCLARPAPLRVPSHEQGMPLWIALARRSWLAHSRHSYIYSDYEGWCDPISSGFAYDRRVFERVGYFDEAFDAAEDVEFHHRLKQHGIVAYTSPALTIYSFPRSTLRGLFDQTVRYGIGRARFLRKYPKASTVETFVPVGSFLLSASAPLALAGAWWMPAVSLTCLAVYVAYWVVLYAAGLWASTGRHRLLSAVMVATAIWTIHLGLGWGFLKSVFLPRRFLFSGAKRARGEKVPASSDEGQCRVDSGLATPGPGTEGPARGTVLE